jgi:hypothetical protein
MNPGKQKGSRPNEDVSTTTQANLAEFHARMDQLQAEIAAQKIDQAEMAEMKAKLAAQETELQRLRQQVSTKLSGLELISEQSKPTSRRAMLKKTAVGLAALGIAAVPLTAQAGDPAIDADGTNTSDPSYGGRFTGNLAPVRLVTAAALPATTTGHAAGELYTVGDATDSALWYYRGTTGGWAKLSGTVHLDNPIRVVGQGNPVNPAFATVATGGATPTYIAIEGTWNNTTATGTVTATIPTNAVSIIGTIAVIAPVANGFATVYPASATGIPFVATINYRVGGVTNNGFTCKLGLIPAGQIGAGKLGIAVVSSQTCTIAIDVVGYTV